MNRRDFLATTAAVAVLPALEARASTVSASARGHGESDFPMPPTRNAMALPVFDAEPGRVLLEKGWRFHLGDIPPPKILGHGWTYDSAKAGAAQGAAAVSYDDSDWSEITLPHDWAAGQLPDPKENVSQAYRARGFGWYRRTIRFDEADRGKYIEIQFGGIATNATVWFNGNVVSHNWSGYNSIYVDVSSMARFGDGLNTLVVRVDAEKMEGWWYEGAGIYRHVWVVKRSPVHIITDGIYADPRQGPDGWTVPVVATLNNIGEQAAEAEIEAVLTDASGHVVASGRGSATITPLDQSEARVTLAVANPALWSVDSPNLYQLRTRLFQGGKQADERRVELGFRTFRFDPKLGFFLNGQPLKIKGTCNHQDHAGVGVAVPDAMWEWRIRRLKELGSNAIRFSHNAPAVEVLDLCDRLGILVMDENRLFNVSPDYMNQLTWLVRRDRNRPSVILWSVFNEEPIQGTPQGFEMVRRMVDAVKELDDQRPVTAAMNSGMFTASNVSHAVDVVGFNYQQNIFDRYHAANPTKPMTSSEDTSSFMTRGAYENDKPAHVIGSYDTNRADWGETHRESWKNVATRPFVAGTFVWTGFDYHGEPTPFEWPTQSSLFGIMDLCGFSKMAFYLHRAQWVDDRPLLDLVPHWNWAGREGQPIKVMALTNLDRVRLLLNGKTVGEQAVDRFVMPTWEVPYAPGRLEAVGYRGGREVLRAAVETTGVPVALRLTPDRAAMAADGEDAQPFTVSAVDAKGRHVPTANLPVEFAISGGTIIGLGNGDPNSHEPEKGNRRSLFNGLAQVIVRADDNAGALILTASSPGLKSARSAVRLLPAKSRPQLESAKPILTVQGIRQSRNSDQPIDPTIRIADNDMNSWPWVSPGEIQPNGQGRWSLFRGKFTPRKTVRQRGGNLVFASITGPAEVWLDGKKVGTKTSAVPGRLTVPIPGGEGERAMSVLVENVNGSQGGLGGIVYVEEK
ncbi:MAG: beta-galactosidase GalA [Sphingomicrobium sp.]